ncbi:MAG: ABC transporter ATP-binding protein [Anaerolineaceae bacterium]|nr:ABC transporter ATP-binding protein [Anaerolineaceae bacterium]MCY3936442.1 ABC transporter ATP-binding protein [Chloroflexota bacterium]MCY4009176.1 ABC transporter ATP-binding protein [Anaerolineaceae bacterium]MCY4106482.1 ABC transporter ATP-binding protein [Chloroflexota bacterium]
MSETLLELRDVHKSFRRGLRQRVAALQGVDLQVSADRPQIITIAGESGSGKSTLGLLALGFLAADGGEVRFRGQELRRLRGASLREFRRSVQAIFQNPFAAFNPFYPVDHILRLTLRNFARNFADEGTQALETADRQRSPVRGRTEMDAAIDEALRALRLDPAAVLGKYPHQLSGGQLQRVMLARAFLLRPRLIIADEPVSMIDASLRAVVLGNMWELKERYGISQLYITHDLSTARQISDTILILYRGRIVEIGAMDRVLDDPQHPYTQLLIQAIPRPDPAQRWQVPLDWQRDDQDVEARDTESGCAFYARCSQRMDRCLAAVPPLLATPADTRAACYLYEGEGVPAS